jgi:hypothetical protein
LDIALGQRAHLECDGSLSESDVESPSKRLKAYCGGNEVFPCTVINVRRRGL